MKSHVPSEELVTEAAGYSVTSDAARTPLGDHLIDSWQTMVKHCDRESSAAGANTFRKQQALQRLARIDLAKRARENPNFVPETTEDLVRKWEAECAARMQAEMDTPNRR